MSSYLWYFSPVHKPHTFDINQLEQLWKIFELFRHFIILLMAIRWIYILKHIFCSYFICNQLWPVVTRYHFITEKSKKNSIFGHNFPLSRTLNQNWSKKQNAPTIHHVKYLSNIFTYKLYTSTWATFHFLNISRVRFFDRRHNKFRIWTNLINLAEPWCEASAWQRCAIDKIFFIRGDILKIPTRGELLHNSACFEGLWSFGRIL